MKNQENILIILAILFGISHYSSCWDFRVYNESFNDYVDVSTANATAILNLSYFNTSLETVFFTFGIDGKADGESVRTVIGAYLSPRKANPILLNWEEEATSKISPAISYLPISAKAKSIGQEFGEILLQLQNEGLNLTTVHPLGFSLGCVIMKNAALTVQNSGKNITRLTGMDCAGPFFEGLARSQGVKASDAKTVVVIHTNPGMLGTYEAQATVDVWLNCGSSIQPGCENNTESNSFGSPQAFCSHKRSFAYFAEAVKNSSAFIARSASSCSSWKAGGGTNKTIALGDYVDTDARGSYYLRTNSAPPHGLGQTGSQPVN